MFVESDSEELAVAAGVEIGALAPPENPTPGDVVPGDIEGDPHGRDSLSEASPSLRNEGGSLQASSLCINAFDMDYFSFHHLPTTSSSNSC